MKYKVQYLLVLLVICSVGIFGNYMLSKYTYNRIEDHKREYVNDCGENEENCSHLPLISINTNGSSIPGLNREDEMVQVDISIIDNQNTSNRLTDEATHELAMIRYRGNSSLSFDKHQYLVKFVEEDGTEKKIELLGMDEENKWILNGPYLDKTLIRNYLAYNISGQLMESVPEVRFVELYKDNEYQGVYLVIESVSRTLTGVTRYKPNWSNGMSSYILRLDRYDETNIMINNFTKYTNRIITDNAINVVYPAEEDLTPEILEYINDDFSKFEKALYSYDYKEYSQYIDVDSFVDYFIINEFFKNSDAGTHSTYLYKDVRGKIHMGPVWDFNNAVNNYVEEEYSHIDFLFQDKMWYDQLLKSEEFVNKIIERYHSLRKGVLSNEYIQSYINDTVSYLGDAIDRNFEVWGYTFDQNTTKDMLRPADRNYTSYEEALEQLSHFLERRGEWMDNNIETLKQYCHESAIKAVEGD